MLNFRFQKELCCPWGKTGGHVHARVTGPPPRAALCKGAELGAWGCGPLGAGGTGLPTPSSQRKFLNFNIQKENRAAHGDKNRGHVVYARVTGPPPRAALCKGAELCAWGCGPLGAGGTGLPTPSSQRKILNFNIQKENRAAHGDKNRGHVYARVTGPPPRAALCKGAELCAWGCGPLGVWASGLPTPASQRTKIEFPHPKGKPCCPWEQKPWACL